MRKIILASQSKARKELFSSLGIPFEVVPANIDEKAIRDNDLKIRAEKIAYAKATKIISEYPDAIVIACDTFSELEGVVLEKPADKTEAKQMLTMLSGKSAVNYTACVYIDRVNDLEFKDIVAVDYTFRTLYEKEIEEYVGKFPVTEWAAGFALILPYVNSFVATVNGSLNGLSYGFPTEILIPLLRKSGFEPNPQR